ncbi:MAG: phage tail sheath subtilisin-like domain-containing protein [bacterium]|nr:phage tail sheath subtilisin-like domain-containing protein [bacterium]
MTSYLSPGVYTKETDFSFYVKQISTSACGMIGIAEKGPVNEPTLVTSWEQFTKKFGSYIQDGYLAYAARAFFDNGGQVLYVSRVVHYTNPADRAMLTAKPATVILKNRKIGESALDTLKISAANEGKWGEGISVLIEDGTANPAEEFNISVSMKGEVVEVFSNLSMDESKSNHVEVVINGRSEYIIADDLSPTANTSDDRPAAGTFSLSAGSNGTFGMTDADYIGDSSQHTGIYAFDMVEDLNILCVPGITTDGVIAGGIGYAEGRKDLLFIADTPIMLTPQEAVEFRVGKGTYTHAAFNSSYGALYYPWIEVSDPLTGSTKLIPPTGEVAGCIARSDEKTEVWYAPAGIDRGKLLGALSLAYNAGRAERDALYSAGVNVIASFLDTGINIWGQKTLQGQASATDRINVRRLMMYIEKAVTKSSRFVVFEPHNAKTWRSLVRTIDPFLMGIKNGGGLYDYRIQCDEETNTAEMIDRNQLVLRIFAKPTKTAEFIELNFILVATGADFKEMEA